MIQPVFTAMPSATISYTRYPKVFTAPTASASSSSVFQPAGQTPSANTSSTRKRYIFEDDDENPFLDRKSNTQLHRDNRPIVTRHCLQEIKSMFPVPLPGQSFGEAIGLRPFESYKNYSEYFHAVTKVAIEYQAAYCLRKSLIEESRTRRYIDIFEEPRRQTSLSFMSYEMISDEKRKATEQDDIESFLWLILHHVLKFTDHNAAKAPGTNDSSTTPRPNLQALMSLIFNGNEKIEEEFGQGYSKMILLLTGRPLPMNFEVKGNKPLTDIVQSLLEKFETRMTFLRRTVPKQVRALSRQLGITYDTAYDMYLASREYTDMAYKYGVKHDDVLAILERGLLDVEKWPVHDRKADS